MNEMNTKEMVSALADGRLDAGQARRCLDEMARDESAVLAWQSYHVIGEVLRSAERGALPPSTVFAHRVAQRLAGETMASAKRLEPAALLPAKAAGKMPRQAANDGVFRWKFVAGIASLAAIAAVGWSILGLGGSPLQQPQLASTQPANASSLVLAGGERGVMIRDARLDELLAAHQQHGGATALQTPSGFLRNATFDGPAR